jgi:hypothetical protein
MKSDEAKVALLLLFILAAFIALVRETPIGWPFFWLFLAWLMNDSRKS